MKSRIPHCIWLLGRLNFLHPSQFLSLHLLLPCQYWRVLVSYFVKCSLFGLPCFCCCWLDLSHWAERKSVTLPGLGARTASVNGVWLPLWTPGCSPLPEGSAGRGQRPRTVSCLLMGLLCGPGEVDELSWLWFCRTCRGFLRAVAD